MGKVVDLVQKFRHEGEKTEAFFSQLGEDAWAVQLYADGAEWSVQEVFAHIVEAEESLLRLFRFIAGGGEGIANGFDIDEYNATAVAKLSYYSSEQLMIEFRDRREEMIGFIESLSEADLEKQGQHPYLGETSLGEMLRLFYLHVNLHIRDVRKELT